MKDRLKPFGKEYLFFLSLCRNERVEPLEESFDWDYFLDILRENRMVLTLGDQLLNSGLLHDSMIQSLKAEVKRLKQEALMNYSTFLKVKSAFLDEGIDCVLLKGLGLSFQLYGDVGGRECRDIDLLVSKEDVYRAERVLLAMGFEPDVYILESPKQKEVFLSNFHHFTFYHPELRVVIELHWRLLSQSYFRSVLTEYRTEMLSCNGVPIPVLSDVDNLMFLCLHGGKHRWKRLFWLHDVCVFLGRMPQDQIEACFHKMKTQGVANYFLEALYMVEQYYGKKYDIGGGFQIKNGAIITHLEDVKLNLGINERYSFRRVMRLFLFELKMGGVSLIRNRVRRFFIDPIVWRYYCFPDSLFFLNYVCFPFLKVISYKK